MHIYESPFYYIDYCIAQCVALGFLSLSREDFDSTLEKYVDFLKKTGGVSLGELVEGAGLKSPFSENALREIAVTAKNVIEETETKI